MKERIPLVPICMIHMHDWSPVRLVALCELGHPTEIRRRYRYVAEGGYTVRREDPWPKSVRCADCAKPYPQVAMEYNGIVPSWDGARTLEEPVNDPA